MYLHLAIEGTGMNKFLNSKQLYGSLSPHYFLPPVQSTSANILAAQVRNQCSELRCSQLYQKSFCWTLLGKETSKQNRYMKINQFMI